MYSDSRAIWARLQAERKRRRMKRILYSLLIIEIGVLSMLIHAVFF